MDDLESRLEHELSGLGRTPLAEPVPVAELRHRARRVRAARALTGVAALGVSVALVVGAVLVVGGRGDHAQTVRVGAPNFLLGDTDAVVLSSTFDADGARNPLPTDLVTTVSHVPGVESVSGVIDTFAPLTATTVVDGSAAEHRTPPRSAILFSFHKDDTVDVTRGRAATGGGEIVVDNDFAARNHKDVGDKVSLQVRGETLDMKIVGIFELPGVDLSGVPMVAMPAAFDTSNLPLDRIDVSIIPGANLTRVRDRVAAAVGNRYTVLEPSAISFADQRLAQVEIQHAYWALLSPDPKERSTSGVGPSNVGEKNNYAKYATLAQSVELRVENVTFLSEDAASLTYRIYYGGSPSPIITEPQSGIASRVDGHWQLGTSTLCSLAALVGIECKDQPHIAITPPNGYEPPSTLDEEIRTAFAALADPHATVDQRIAAIADGEAYRSVIEAGVGQDDAYPSSKLMISGWKSTGPRMVQILYSLTTPGGPSTPWPSNATAEQDADGHWHAAEQYACGMQGLASGGCFDAHGQPVTATAPVAPGSPGSR